MKNILKNKLFIILAFFILLCTISTSCFALTPNINFTYEGTEYNITFTSAFLNIYKDANYAFIVKYKNGSSSYYALVLSKTPLTSEIITEGPEEGSTDTIYIAHDNNLTDLVDDVNKGFLNKGFMGYSVTEYVFSTYDIKDNSGNMVFQVAPQEEETQVEQTMIATQITLVDFSQVITELLALLPILLVVLIGLLALRKAIQLLLQTLRRS